MEREAQMPHQAVALELAHVAPQVHALILLVVAFHEGVQQVVVDVAGAGALERGLELLARRALRRGHRGVKLGGKRVTLARMAVYQRFLDSLLGACIDMGCIKVGEACVEETIDHFAGLHNIDTEPLLGKTHESKAQLGGVLTKPLCHDCLPMTAN